MLHVGSVCTPCCMLLRVVASCCAMLDPFAQLLQHCWGHPRALHMVCLEFTKSYRCVSFPRCTAGPNIVWSCCILLHTTAKTDTTISNSIASVFTGLDLNRSLLFKCVCVCVCVGGGGGGAGKGVYFPAKLKPRKSDCRVPPDLKKVSPLG